ncbi:MAG TPA: glutathione peroxidase [Usitatibacter sp.]|nr:glutathione peroxidase [Usitatibacter sp.]
MLLPNSEGKRVPQVTFRTRQDGQWKDITSDQVFKGRTVVVFSLPGAYTPTCSSSHLPRYNELVPTFKKAGVDEVVVVSVNDGFVMSEWQKAQDAPNVTFLPDGNGDFTAGMNMLVDKRDLGFGKRSWRYSMLVKDGVVQKQFIEPDKEGDPFEVSDADTMLKYVAPNLKAPEPVTIFAKVGCPHCARAKALLEKNGLVYEEVTLGDGITTSTLRAVSGKGTTPQVFIGGKLIGGADDLERYFAGNNKLAA